MVRSLILGLAFISVTALAPAVAQAPVAHDYRAVAPAEHNGFEGALIIDNATGDVWRVWQAPGNATMPSGTGVTYITRLRPGTHDNEVVMRQGLGLPPIVSVPAPTPTRP